MPIASTSRTDSPKRYLLDTNVFVYALGTNHPLRGPARALLQAAGAGDLEITTTTMVLQEFLHVRSARRSRTDAAALTRDLALACDPLLPVDRSDLTLAVELFEVHPPLDAFDALLAAVGVRAGVDALVSADRAFGVVEGLTWRDLAGYPADTTGPADRDE
ncbi:MAG: type II toxin-antitoxin system VapC family toxin [Geodermatophilaceae bacterium]